MYYFQKGEIWKMLRQSQQKTQKKAILGSFLLAETKMMSIFAIPIL